MPLNYARRLVGEDRSVAANRQLGLLLAFVAGATNAGAFLAVGTYTSHMTGIVSAMADHLVLGHLPLVLGALGALLSFTLGAALTAVLVNFARRHQLRSLYATPLLLEASLLLVFGLVGPRLSANAQLAVPATVMLLCLAMGLQNALISKISKSEIRTTHVTGLVTDIGIELGKAMYRNRATPPGWPDVAADRERLFTLSALLAAFFVGGLAGALGFSHLGYGSTAVLAVILLMPAAVLAADDVKHRLAR